MYSKLLWICFEKALFPEKVAAWGAAHLFPLLRQLVLHRNHLHAITMLPFAVLYQGCAAHRNNRPSKTPTTKSCKAGVGSQSVLDSVESNALHAARALQ